MKMRRLKKALSFFLCMALCVAMALMTTGCSDKNEQVRGENAASESVQTAGDNASSNGNEVTVLGEGDTKFPFSVVDKEGNETSFEICTNQKNVGAALLELELIAGEEGPFGLYVKTVNGITLDYDKDKAYWAFYVNDSYAVSGVDLTEIAEGEVYSFRMEK